MESQGLSEAGDIPVAEEVLDAEQDSDPEEPSKSGSEEAREDEAACSDNESLEDDEASDNQEASDREGTSDAEDGNLALNNTVASQDTSAGTTFQFTDVVTAIKIIEATKPSATTDVETSAQVTDLPQGPYAFLKSHIHEVENVSGLTNGGYPICPEPYKLEGAASSACETRKAVRFSPCQHIVCGDCLVLHLCKASSGYGSKCPICRASLFETNQLASMLADSTLIIMVVFIGSLLEGPKKLIRRCEGADDTAFEPIAPEVGMSVVRCKQLYDKYKDMAFEFMHLLSLQSVLLCAGMVFNNFKELNTEIIPKANEVKARLDRIKATKQQEAQKCNPS